MRRVEIKGTATLITTFRDVDGVEAEIKEKFRVKGWEITQLDFQQKSVWNPPASVHFDIYIVANVQDQYSNQEIADNAAEVLSRATIWIPIYGYQSLFSNILVRVEGGNSNNSNGQPTATSGNPKTEENQDKPILGEGVFKELAAALGISVDELKLYGGALILILLLRR